MPYETPHKAREGPLTPQEAPEAMKSYEDTAAQSYKIYKRIKGPTWGSTRKAAWKVHKANVAKAWAILITRL